MLEEQNLSDVKLFNNVPGYDIDSSIGDKSPLSETTNTLQLRTTQRNSDLLLQKIADNLETLQQAEK